MKTKRKEESAIGSWKKRTLVLAAKSLETLVTERDMENRKCPYKAGWSGRGDFQAGY